MRTSFFVGALIFCFVAGSYGAEPKIEISGVIESAKGPSAVINGRLCTVNDKIGEGVITAIDLNGVTISRNGKKKVHKVGSAGATKAGAVKQKKGSGFSAWFESLGNKKKKPKTQPKCTFANTTQPNKPSSSSCGAANSPFQDKMRRAELLYKKEVSEFGQFRSRTLNSCKSQSDFERAIERYNTMVRVNLSKIRHLELPQSGPAEYNQWVGSYLSRLDSMRTGNLKEIETAMKRAGYASGRITLTGTDLLRSKK